MNIPDYVTPIVGYRAWQWNCTGWNPHSAPLKSFNDEWWSPGRPIAATCNAGSSWASMQPTDVVRERHQAPHASCTCGIYAAKSSAQLGDLRYAGRGICGEVYLWGTVIEHQSGWRAQFAYPKTLFVSFEGLLLGGFVRPELEELELQSYLDSLTAYGADVFWDNGEDEKEKAILWSAGSGYKVDALESLHEAARCGCSATWVADGLPLGAHLPIFKGASRLSPPELKIVKYMAQGLNNHEIAQRTGMGHLTLKNSLSHIFDKLGVSSRIDLLSLIVSKTSHC